MILKPYQEQAVSNLLQRASELLADSEGRKIVFKAPTGSGKTIMMAEFLKQLSSLPSQEEFCVIWAAPRKLHTQSMRKLENYYGDSKALTCSEFFGLANNQITRNQILFLNWESINRTDENIIVKENESDFYLDRVIENTKEQGLKIVMVIDESHHHATSETSRGLIELMSPNLTIEVSATPVLQDADELVNVRIDDVRAQGMIKKGIILNPDFENSLSGDNVVSSLSHGSDAFVLRQALQKRTALKKEYESVGSSVNPLLLIQLPDRRSALSDELLKEILVLLSSEFDISIDDKLALYFSENQTPNLANIAMNDSPVEVMLFKQAISLGWDCPRAQILVLFRDHKSLTFSIQTVGRIMRMPEPDYGHYLSEELNHSYVYSNLADISINEDLASGYVTINSSKLSEDAPALNLRSVHSKRQREKTRLNVEFTKILIALANEQEISRKLARENLQVTRDFLSDVSVSHVDGLKDTELSGDLSVGLEGEIDLQKLFDSFVIRNLQPFFPEERSIGRLKTSIYKILLAELGVDYEQEQILAFKLVLDKGNQVVWSNLIDEAKSAYLSSVSAKEHELQETDNWNLPVSLSYPSSFIKMDVKKSVQRPFFFDNKWKSEIAFIKFLEANEKVTWWFKNGDRDATFFAVSYSEGEIKKPFYVDFIVGLASGEIGLFDTKSGQTIETARSKSDGLQEYLSSNPKLIGGIVTSTSRDYSGRWVCFRRNSNEIELGDFSNWETLEF
jgi:type III restriction enzyme